MAPQFTCTLPGEGRLRFNWMDTGDAVTEYQDCVCDGDLLCVWDESSPTIAKFGKDTGQ